MGWLFLWSIPGSELGRSLRCTTMYLWFGWQWKCCCNNWKSILLFPLYFKTFKFVSGVWSFPAFWLLSYCTTSTSLIIHWSGSDSALHTPVREPEEPGRHNPHPSSPHTSSPASYPHTYPPTHQPTFTQYISTAFVSALRASTLVPESTSAQTGSIPCYI